MDRVEMFMIVEELIKGKKFKRNEENSKTMRDIGKKPNKTIK